MALAYQIHLVGTFSNECLLLSALAECQGLLCCSALAWNTPAGQRCHLPVEKKTCWWRTSTPQLSGFREGFRWQPRPLENGGVLSTACRKAIKNLFVAIVHYKQPPRTKHAAGSFNPFSLTGVDLEALFPFSKFFMQAQVGSSIFC